MADRDLARFETWFGRIIAGLAPAERRRAALGLGQALRAANLRRIAANVDPDGAPMERGKARYDRRGRLRARAGRKMFRGLRAVRNWKIAADEDGVEIAPLNGLIDRLAAINQFAETATIGRLRDGRRIRYRYPERRLLGFSEEDQRLALDIASALVDRAPG